MKNVHRLGAIAVLAVLAACGGGSGSDDENDQPNAATITLAGTVIKVGETKTVTVAVGQQYTLTASEPTKSLTYNGCWLDLGTAPFDTGLTSYTFTVQEKTKLCTMRVGLTGGEATVLMQVP